jgi:hypothetical protein
MTAACKKAQAAGKGSDMGKAQAFPQAAYGHTPTKRAKG